MYGTIVKGQDRLKEKRNPLWGYCGFGCSTSRAMIVGVAMMQVRTIAELAMARIRNEPASSPAASNPKPTASTMSDPFAKLVVSILFLRVSDLMLTSMNGVR